MIPYGLHEVTKKDIEAVIAVLQSEFLTQGPVVPRFEQTFASHIGVKHVIAVNSATSALHVACKALGLGAGDWLWTSPITFVASANCGLYCGAQVDFVDIDPRSYNISPEALKTKLIEANKRGRLPKILVVVHFSGQSCDMMAINALSKEYGFKVIEDASHAVGGKYKGDYIGSGKYSDITVFSFHPVKIITTAEGGVAVTNNDTLAWKMRLLRSHGINRDIEEVKNGVAGAWYYEQIELGYNYRMSELQAALGLSQLERLEFYISKRCELAYRYDELLATLPLTIPWQSPHTLSSRHLYVIRIKADTNYGGRQRVFNALRQAGVGVNVHYIPVHLQPFYRKMGFNEGDFPESEKYYSEAITIPLYPTMKVSEQNYISEALKEILKK